MKNSNGFIAFAALLLTVTSAFAQFGAGPGPVPHLGLAGLSGQVAQPQVTLPVISSILNAANFHDTATYGIVPGELIAIYGTGFVAGNTKVEINGIVSTVTYSSATQINAQVPTSLVVGQTNVIVFVSAAGTFSMNSYRNVTAQDPGLYGCGSAPWIENQAYQIVGTCGYPALSSGAYTGFILWGNAFAASGSGTCTASVSFKQGLAWGYGTTPIYCGLVPGSTTEFQANFAFQNNNPAMPAGVYTATVTIDGIVQPTFSVNISQ